MNQRIQNLIKQCTVQEFSDCVGGYETFDQEKFAQLIVQECAQVLWNIDNGELHDEYVESLKKHFGIES
jgi:hypothetical protein